MSEEDLTMIKGVEDNVATAIQGREKKANARQTFLSITYRDGLKSGPVVLSNS